MDWAHAPVHRFELAGAYMVTAGTWHKHVALTDGQRLRLVRDKLFELASESRWQLQAWAVMGNHYHFVALAPDDPKTLGRFVRRLHAITARELNLRDGCPGRRVWYEYWETRLRTPKAYYTRLRYVHENPVHHGVVRVATEYQWASANWFQQQADGALKRMVASYAIDRLDVPDDF